MYVNLWVMDCLAGYLFYMHVFMLNNVNCGRAERGIAIRPLYQNPYKGHICNTFSAPV